MTTGARLRGTAAAVALAVTSVFTTGTPASAGDVARDAFCHGHKVTIDSHYGLIIGTPGPDVIRAYGKSTIYGLGGDDVICGSSKADRINGGSGRDTIYAGSGKDRVTGGPGKDRIFGEGGADRLFGGRHRDELYGGPGVNRFNGNRMPAHMNARAAAPDYINDDPNVLEVAFTSGGLSSFLGQGSNVTLTRSGTFSASTGGTTITGVPVLPVAWQSFSPQLTNTITWPNTYSAYTADGTIAAGLFVLPGATAPMSLGQTATINMDGQLQTTPGPAGFLTISDEGYGSLMTGLASAATINTQLMPAAPTVAVGVVPQLTVSLGPQTGVGITAGSPQLANTMLASSPAPMTASGGSVLTLNYNAGSQSFAVAQ